MKIINQMRVDKFEPEVIVSIARSGLIPAAMLAYVLGNKELYVVKVDFSKTQKSGKDQDLAYLPTITGINQGYPWLKSFGG